MEIFSACCLNGESHSKSDSVSFYALSSEKLSIEVSGYFRVHDVIIDKQQAIELAKAILSYYEED